MTLNFIACDREQDLLLPPSLRVWLPDGHFGVGCGRDAFGVQVTDALLFAATLIAGAGDLRWDGRQHPH